MKNSSLIMILSLAIALFCSNICLGQTDLEEWQKRIDANYKQKTSEDKKEYSDYIKRANNYYNTAQQYLKSENYDNAISSMNESIMCLENAKRFLSDRDEISELESRIAVRTAELRNIGIQKESKESKESKKETHRSSTYYGGSANSVVCDSNGNCVHASSGH